MKIYTKTGDKGDTSLIGGERVGKNDPRIEAYGTIDELNAFIGLAITHLPLHIKELRDDLIKIQHHLFDIGAELASLSDRKVKAMKIPRVRATKIAWLEDHIDRYHKEVPELKHFILPGGSETSSALHVARSVCRRAERAIIALADTQSVNPELIKYINRLSDFFFAAARYSNHKTGTPDTLWEKDS